MIRTFVALRPAPAQRHALEALGLDLDCGRATTEPDLHLTLAFLGDQDRHVLEDAAAELDRLRIPRPMISFSGVGVFDERRPRSAHALAHGDETLGRLAKAVRRAAEMAGIAPERRKFLPHVTVARFNASAPADPEDLADWTAAHAGFALDPAPAESFSIYRSDLTRAGPIYAEAMRFDFAGAPAEGG